MSTVAKKPKYEAVAVKPVSDYFKSLLVNNEAKVVWISFNNSVNQFFILKRVDYTNRELADILAHLTIRNRPKYGKPVIRLLNRKQHKRMVKNRVY